MKRVLSLLFALIISLSCVIVFSACDSGSTSSKRKTTDEETITCSSCGEENPDNVKFCSNCGERLEEEVDDDKTDKVTKKTAKEKLCEYILEKGANYQGTYKIIYLDTDGDSSTTISYTEQGDIVFSYYIEAQSGSTGFVTLKLYDGSVTQTVEYQYELSGYTCTATGTLYTNIVSNDNCSLSGVTYRENFPSSVKQSTIENIVKTSDTATKAMLSSVDFMLAKYVGIRLKDLGFTNW